MNSEEAIEWLKKNKLSKVAEDCSSYLEKVFNDCLDAKDEKILVIGDTGTKNQNVAAVLSYAYYLAGKKNKLEIDFVLQNIKTRGDTADEDVVEKLKDILPENE